MNTMTKLSIDAAEKRLTWANTLNPGLWVDHSKEVAKAAAKIASQCNMNTDLAYGLGLMHDVGRYKGVSDMMHILDGYRLMQGDGYHQAAQICITHSFPTHAFEEYSGRDDCNDVDRAEIMDILQSAVYTQYDMLIQLCDALALPSGVCLMEKRLVDVALRHGTHEYTVFKWRKLFSIFQIFQSKMDVPLYSLFPEIAENTFRI